MGLLIVYTGNGKGKTTAALGLVFRALGHGWRTAFLQFIKGDRGTGEARFAGGLSGLLDFRTLGRGFVLPGREREKDRDAALSAWEQARDAVLSGRFRVRDLPATFVVSPEGKVRWVGGPDQNEDDLSRVVEN